MVDLEKWRAGMGQGRDGVWTVANKYGRGGAWVDGMMCGGDRRGDVGVAEGGASVWGEGKC